MRVLRRRPPLIVGGFGGMLFDFLGVFIEGAALFEGLVALFDGATLFDFVELLLIDTDGSLFAVFDGAELKIPIIKLLRN